MTIDEEFAGSAWRSIVNDLLFFPFEENKRYQLIIKEKKQKRSIQANDYSWVLTGKLAEKMLVAGVKLSKLEMHAEMVHRYGQIDVDDDGLPVFVKALSDINVAERYPYAFPVGDDDEGFTKWLIYRPSHTYTRAEFSIFLQGIIEECKEQGIDTKTPDEIARMISLMKEA